MTVQEICYEGFSRSIMKGSRDTDGVGNSEKRHETPHSTNATLFKMASQLSLEEIQHLQGFEYRPESDVHRWNLPEDKQEPKKRGDGSKPTISPTVIERIAEWQKSDCKALERADMVTDILLCDRMAVQNVDGALDNAILARSDQIFFRSSDGMVEITGFPDRAVGFKKTGKNGNELFMLVVVRTSTPTHFDDALTQLILYLFGTFDALASVIPDQDKRKTFGFVTDSVWFKFAMVGPDRVLRLSKKLGWFTEREKILSYLDYGIEHVLLTGFCAVA